MERSQKGLEKRASIGTLCLCKKRHQKRWMPPANVARIWSALQEGKSVKALLSVTDVSAPAIAARSAEKRQVAKEGTMFAGLRTPTEVVVLVVTLLSYGCPIQAIVHAFGLDERTVARWRDRAGTQCEQVHQAIVEQGQLDLVHVQADEIRVKGRGRIVWMGLAMMVSTRLWLAGVVSPSRDTALADRLLKQVCRCELALRAVLVCTDGWAAYPNSIRRAIRSKVKITAGRGRACL
jgi:transposase-like protein